jgi:hypothetical protein
MSFDVVGCAFDLHVALAICFALPKRGQSWVACYSHAIFAPRGTRSEFALPDLAPMVNGMSSILFSFLVFLVESVLSNFLLFIN